ncbi:DUF3465 domain-containing protein [soil metagenome]
MRTTIVIFVTTLLAAQFSACSGPQFRHQPVESASVERAIQQRQSDVQVEGEGVVTRLLSDDKEGSRHQRIILRLSSGQTVLVQHNIDLAPRIAKLKEGDTVSFFGEYIWNEQGGIIHWTHHDPAGRHVGGWLKHNGRTYQ